MTRGLIDMASLTSALGAVRQRRNKSLSPWHDQSLIEVTYLLLHDKMRVIPHPGPQGGEVGDVATFYKLLPEITTNVNYNKQKSALDTTRRWLHDNQRSLLTAWLSAEENTTLWKWARQQRKLRWLEHAETYGGLFDKAFIPYIAQVLQQSERDIKDLHSKSTDPRNIKGWIKKDTSDATRLLERAWVLGGIIRGKYYENLAKSEKIQLVAHPFRKSIEEDLEVGILPQPIYRSEELFIKILIKSAQVETTAARRVAALAENIKLARRAILGKAVNLEETLTNDDAEKFAARAAKDAGIIGTSKLNKLITEIFVNFGAPYLLSYGLSFWGVPPQLTLPLVTSANIGYKLKKGESPGADVAKVAYTTQARFKWLARQPSGRIERTLVTIEDQNKTD